MGKTSTQVVTKDSTPWAEQIPYLSDVMAGAQNLYESQPVPEFYGGQTYANFDPLQLQSANMLGNYATGTGSNLIGGAQGGLANALNQTNPAANPYLDYGMSMAPASAQTLKGMMGGGVNPYANEMVSNAMQQAGQGYQDLATARARAYADEIMPQLGQAQGLTQSAIRQFQEGISPQIRNTAMSTGNFDSSRRGIAEGLAASRIGENLTNQLAGIEGQANLGAARTMQDLIQAGTRQGQGMAGMAANMYGGAYEQGQNRALNAAQYGGSALGNAYSGAIGAQLGGLGLAPSMYELGTKPSEALMNIGNMYQTQDQRRIQDAMTRHQYAQDAPWLQLGNYNNMIQGSYGGSTSMPYYSNPMMGAVGGGLAGYGATSSPWGALLGAAAGYYGSQ